MDGKMTIRTFENAAPRIGARVFVAPNATVIGDVEIGDDVSIWYNVVLRGDIHWIRIGARSNVQDGAIVHVENGLYPTILEEEVSVGHGAILHGCTIAGGTLVGMGAKILNDATIGRGVRGRRRVGRERRIHGAAALPGCRSPGGGQTGAFG